MPSRRGGLLTKVSREAMRDLLTALGYPTVPCQLSHEPRYIHRNADYEAESSRDKRRALRDGLKTFWEN